MDRTSALGYAVLRWIPYNVQTWIRRRYILAGKRLAYIRSAFLPFLLFFTMGVGSWLLATGIFAESPILIQTQPEGQAISVYMDFAINLGNVAPFAYVLLQRRRPFPDYKAISILMMINLAVVVLFLLTWREQLEVAGEMRSTALLVCTFFAGVVGNTAMVAFFPFASQFDGLMTSAMSSGIGAAGLVAQAFSIMQDIREADEEHGDPKTRFSIEVYMGLIFVCLTLSGLSFFSLNWLWIGKLVRKKPAEGTPEHRADDTEGGINNHRTRNHGGGAGDIEMLSDMDDGRYANDGDGDDGDDGAGIAHLVKPRPGSSGGSGGGGDGGGAAGLHAGSASHDGKKLTHGHHQNHNHNHNHNHTERSGSTSNGVSGVLSGGGNSGGDRDRLREAVDTGMIERDRLELDILEEEATFEQFAIERDVGSNCPGAPKTFTPWAPLISQGVTCFCMYTMPGLMPFLTGGGEDQYRVLSLLYMMFYCGSFGGRLVTSIVPTYRIGLCTSAQCLLWAMLVLRIFILKAAGNASSAVLTLSMVLVFAWLHGIVNTMAYRAHERCLDPTFDVPAHQRHVGLANQLGAVLGSVFSFTLVLTTLDTD